MPSTGARPRRIPPVAALLALVAVAAGCGENLADRKPVEPSPTPLARVNTDVLRLPRADFCAAVPGEAVRDVLGGTGRGATWQDGEVTALDRGRDDAVQEFGCRWTRDTRAAAAWTFAPPVSPRSARAVVASVRREAGCRAASPAFGEPGVRQTCRLAGGVVRLRVAGLVGDTWLTCEVRDRTPDVRRLQRLGDAWCVQVLNALGAPRAPARPGR